MDDLDAMLDDGNRYELIDGLFLISPAPSPRHQRNLLKLAIALELACPVDMLVLPAPFAVRPSRSTELQPDVLVARKTEIFSPSSVINDLNNKKAAYERMGRGQLLGD